MICNTGVYSYDASPDSIANRESRFPFFIHFVNLLKRTDSTWRSACYLPGSSIYSVRCVSALPAAPPRHCCSILTFLEWTENELPSEPDSSALGEVDDERISIAGEGEAEESRVDISNPSEREEDGIEGPMERENELVARIKYTLATSSLLASRLELSLYPQSSTPPTTSRLERTAPTSMRSEIKRDKVEWGAGWETRGTRWNDDGVLRDAGVVGSWIVAYIWQIVLLVWSQYAQKEPTTTESATKILESPVEMEPSVETSTVANLKTGVLGTINRLVSVSQQLDNRISRSLGGIREVEGVGLGLGMSVQSFSLAESSD